MIRRSLGRNSAAAALSPHARGIINIPFRHILSPFSLSAKSGANPRPAAAAGHNFSPFPLTLRP